MQNIAQETDFQSSPSTVSGVSVANTKNRIVSLAYRSTDSFSLSVRISSRHGTTVPGNIPYTKSSPRFSAKLCGHTFPCNADKGTDGSSDIFEQSDSIHLICGRSCFVPSLIVPTQKMCPFILKAQVNEFLYVSLSASQ